MLYATRAEYTFLSLHGTFTKTEYILGHKKYLNKSENTKIIQAMLLRPQRHLSRYKQGCLSEGYIHIVITKKGAHT